jgi:hypothetical protein
MQIIAVEDVQPMDFIDPDDGPQDAQKRDPSKEGYVIYAICRRAARCIDIDRNTIRHLTNMQSVDCVYRVVSGGVANRH